MYGSPLLRCLPGVGALSGGVRALDECDIGLRMVRADRLDQAVDGAGRLRAREESGQERAERR